MNNKRILKNIGVSMLMKPISILLSFVYTPIALAFLGETKYGVWAIILNIISWINYFDIGIGNGLRNKLAEAVVLGDRKAAKTYVSTAYLGTSIVSICFCVILTLIWNLFNLSSFFNLNLPDENSNLIVFLSILFVCINFVLSLSRTSAYAIQQPGIISVVGVFGQFIQIAAVWGISHHYHENLLAIAILYGFVSLFDNVVLYFIAIRKKDYLRPNLACAKKEYLAPLLTLGAGFFVLQICSLILNTTDNLLISNLYGSADVTPYSIVYKVFYFAVQFHGIIIMPMWSAYTEAAARKDMCWIRNTMRKINVITLFLSLGVLVGIFVFEPFSKIWLHRELEYGTMLIVIVGAYMIIQMFANNYASFLCGVGYIKASVVISAIGAVLNIPLSIFFAKNLKMGLSGIILGSFSVMILGLVVLPTASHRWIKTKTAEWGL